MTDKREDENVRDHYIDCLTMWKEYRKAVEIIDDNIDNFKTLYNKWDEKLVRILKLSGDREWIIDECRKRCISSGYKLKYYEALKEVVPKEEWKGFMTKLWDDIDWNVDSEEAEAKIAIQEKMTDRIKMFFVHKHWKLWEVLPQYIKYVPKKDHAFVGRIMSDEVKRLALLKKKPKEFAWLLEHVENVMWHSRMVDNAIKDGIKNLIAENPDNFYMRKYLESVL